MNEYVPFFNTLFASGIVVIQVATLVLLSVLIFNRSRNNTICIFFKRYGFYFGFAVMLGSMLISLFYSEIIGYAACELCIVQRFFIYPQVLILGLLIWWKEKKSLVYASGILSFFGMLVSIYHVYVENGGASDLACSTYKVGAVTCSARYVFEFGYITIPVMALTAQLFILLLLVNYKYMTKK